MINMIKESALKSPTQENLNSKASYDMKIDITTRDILFSNHFFFHSTFYNLMKYKSAVLTYSDKRNHKTSITLLI